MVPLALLVALIAWSWKPHAPDVADLARTGRVRSAFAELRALLDTRPIGLDELNRLGEPHGIRFFDDWIPSKRPTTCASSASSSEPGGLERRVLEAR